MRPLVSIIMPAHEAQRFVRRTIESVNNQTFKSWQLIVIDDASRDHTFRQICVGTLLDHRIHICFTHTSLGPAGARNFGLDLAVGRYIAFCDSDDIWMPDKLEKQLQTLQSSDHGICCTAYTRIDAEGHGFGSVVTPPAVIDYDRLLRSNCIGMSTAMIDTHVCGPVRLPIIARRQDYALWLQLARQGHTAIGLSEPLVKYRVHPGSLSSNKLKAAYYHWKVLRDLEKIPLTQALKYFARYGIDATKKRL